MRLSAGVVPVERSDQAGVNGDDLIKPDQAEDPRDREVGPHQAHRPAIGKLLKPINTPTPDMSRKVTALRSTTTLLEDSAAVSRASRSPDDVARSISPEANTTMLPSNP